MILSSDVFSNPEETGLAGTPGRRILTFSVVGPGKSGIRLEYKRPWERNARPERVFQLLLFATGEAPRPFSEEEKIITPRVNSKGQIVPEKKGDGDAKRTPPTFLEPPNLREYRSASLALGKGAINGRPSAIPDPDRE